MNKFKMYKRVLPSLGPIIFHHIFQLVNIIIFSVVILLFVFGNGQSGLFLAIVFILNTLIVIIQDIQARIVLEKLQMLTTLKITRINEDKTESLILAEEIKKGDSLKLKLGDQVPCDGIFLSADNLEISEALITGESDSFPKTIDSKVMAGSIITSGYGVMQASDLFIKSRLHVITGGVKKYAANPSSIQKANNKVIKYLGYIFFAVLLFVILRGVFIHESRLNIVMNIGALASALIPQGLVVVTTLLFAIGALNYSKRNILFQEINATEKLGWIKNLCIDKTGTLTDNILAVESVYTRPNLKEEDTLSLSYSCILGLGDSSQSILAVKRYLENNKIESNKIKTMKILPFSSWRRYGAVKLQEENKEQVIFVGTPDIFLPIVSNPEEKKWLEEITNKNVIEGKRILCIANSNITELPKDIRDAQLSMMAVFVFHNTIREGVIDAIKFFQDRGVHIRVLSGDNAQTVKAVALKVGINNSESVVTGEEMDKWSHSDFETLAHKYSIFAQILPEHKVKLVEAFKKDGFTAMVGDGVNDALAIKNADLGISMLDAVPVTRQVAGIILMKNSFTDLPRAVGLADHFIRSIEITSGIYINQCLITLFFFVIISVFGYSFPLTPLNITFINYFTVGFSGILISYWALSPSRKILPSNGKPFLKKIMPLIFYCSVIEAIGVSIILFFSPQYLKIASSNTLVWLSFIVFGYLFLIIASKVYCGILSRQEKIQLFLLGIFELVVLYIALKINFIVYFFNITKPYPSLDIVGKTLIIFMIFGFIQYLISRKFLTKK